MTQFQKVKDFNVAFGVTMFDNFSTNLIIEHPELAKLRFHLIEEEVCELDDAIKNNDFIETIDKWANKNLFEKKNRWVPKFQIK